MSPSPDPVLLFADYFRAFEACLATNDWEPLRPWLCDDVTYEVEGVPFACTLRGADAVLRGFRTSTDAFDRKLDARSLDIVVAHRLDARRVRVELISGYERAGAPPLRVPVTIELELRDGRIARLHDSYDPDFTAGALRWIQDHGEGLDPRYEAA